MSLKALLVRADGALAETNELERAALNRVLSEAGYQWTCDRQTFFLLTRFPERRDKISNVIDVHLKTARNPQDRVALIDAMVRRMASIMQELIAEHAVKLRAGVRDVLFEARREGVPVGLVSSMPEGELSLLARAFFESWPEDAFAALVGRTEKGQEMGDVYRRALGAIGAEGPECLAIEATSQGLAAAEAHGIPTVVTLSKYADTGSLEGALAIVKSLPQLASPALRDALGPYGPEDRANLLASLLRLHAGLSLDPAFYEGSSIMRVSEILVTKGSVVKSTSASETIKTLSQRLRQEGVGAMVVLSPDGEIVGIISERDLARGIADHGSALPDKTVGDLMTKSVITCTPADSIVAVSKTMTQRRIRHLPVIDGGRIVGLVSIGDILNHRLDQMQQEVNVLRDYAIARR